MKNAAGNVPGMKSVREINSNTTCQELFFSTLNTELDIFVR